MAHIVVDGVSVVFPLYGASGRSLKQTLIHYGSGGSVGRDAAERVTVQALHDVSFTAEHGDRIGLIGPNGGGKSTLLRVLAGIYEPARGSIRCEGRVVPLFDPQLGMEGEATGYENIILRGLFLGLDRHGIQERVEEIAAFTELGEYLDLPVRVYSSGMKLRLAFAISTAVDPDILLLDEWMASGDAHFVEKAERRMNELIGRSSILVLASHSEDLIRRFCNKGLYLDGGRVKSFGPLEAVLGAYREAA
jgi:ABC-2 type transport system ATP-binding protein